MSIFNAEGEPMMTAAELRFEHSLDMDSYDQDLFYDRWDDEPEPLHPSECTHDNIDFSDRDAECRDCESRGVLVVNNWPEVGMMPAYPDDPQFILWNI